MSNSAEHDIQVFADSGHQYRFLPLEFGSLGDSAAPIIDRCRKENSGWGSWQPDLQWVRFRWGNRTVEGLEPNGDVKFETAHGLWIAIETNCCDACIQDVKESGLRGIVMEDKILPKPERFKDPQGPNSPYVARPSQLPSSFTLPPGPLATFTNPPRIVITWVLPNANVRDVDLIVDLGNTRTAALLLEINNQAPSLRSLMATLRFSSRGSGHETFTAGPVEDDPTVVVESWTVMHEGVFSDMEPPGKPQNELISFDQIEQRPKGLAQVLFRLDDRFVRRIRSCLPQMFVELAPVVIGGGRGKDGAAALLRDLDLSQGGRYFLSSPKRYAWDSDLVGGQGQPFWNVIWNRWSPQHDKNPNGFIPRLSGPLLLLSANTGIDWRVDCPPNEVSDPTKRSKVTDVPTHPRREALTWLALSIIERAGRQIADQAYRVQMGSPSVPRRLRNVIVTYPSGWSGVEVAEYRQRWEQALNIYAVGHLKNRELVDQRGATFGKGERPNLIFDLNEAVASQLPILYSEIDKAKFVDVWMELYGRANGESSTVRIISIDIGGGTTDVAIVEYACSRQPNTNQINLAPKVLYTDSSNLAGDAIVKKIIERVLLPSIALANNFKEDTSPFTSFFANPAPEWVGRYPVFFQEMARAVRLVFIPIIHAWLSECADGNALGSAAPKAPRDFKHRTANLVDKGVLDKINEMAAGCGLTPKTSPLIPWDRPINYDRDELFRCIRVTFEALFHSHAALTTAFECDLVFVSGKPSELQTVRQMLYRALPISPTRITFSKDYPAGAWYPLSGGKGDIRDAKTVTVAGAALFQAMREHLIRGWFVDVASKTYASDDVEWVELTTEEPRQVVTTVLDKHTSNAEIEFRDGTILGFRLPGASEVRARYRVSLSNTPAGQLRRVKVARVESASCYPKLALHSDDVSVVAPQLRLCALETGANLWGEQPPNNSPARFERTLILDSDQAHATRPLSIGSRIGRKRYRSPNLMPDQVYVFRMRPGFGLEGRNPNLQVVIERDWSADGAEFLHLVSVVDDVNSANPITIGQVELKLSPIPEVGFWMDHPTFDAVDATR